MYFSAGKDSPSRFSNLIGSDPGTMPIPTSRALIVTEDPELGPVLVDVLDACGVHATITLGANAIDRLIHEDPDFILTDLDIKESDPLQLLQQLYLH